MIREKESFVSKNKRQSCGALPGIQLYLFPEMNDVNFMSKWVSALWNLRKKQYPDMDNELQLLAKRRFELTEELVRLYKTQEEMQNQIEEPTYWYNNIESRDLEPDQTESIEHKITKANAELTNVKKRIYDIINKMLPEHNVYLDVLKSVKTKTL